MTSTQIQVPASPPTTRTATLQLPAPPIPCEPRHPPHSRRGSCMGAPARDDFPNVAQQATCDMESGQGLRVVRRSKGVSMPKGTIVAF
eukprot:1189376-Prorocentrum_minimum.AAC.6